MPPRPPASTCGLYLCMLFKAFGPEIEKRVFHTSYWSDRWASLSGGQIDKEENTSLHPPQASPDGRRFGDSLTSLTASGQTSASSVCACLCFQHSLLGKEQV
ncbi:hypothetical protein BaRGS_00000619 [Batillaria attramentaria]|uniref:Secreted protein n=1 Tax=Batillaria attramentaria TaxID=370345 RepID=A0ABD0MAB7_9CAEN